MRTASTAATPAVTGPATDEGECKEAVSLSKGTTEVSYNNVSSKYTGLRLRSHFTFALMQCIVIQPFVIENIFYIIE